ncbi:hypothetical protein HCJ76_44080 [Streptomyces sp. MC1]|uniref:hypothetical protein n=1 Tax=Streptomyces sp. MC1 TaxID=295105 RepID=UPI0018CA12DC|nr:hypothetical protein [Streptomyces sp. MC1]MBG7704863.1 hypothetical protein [Streptomyces sp. MC1]
MDALPTLTLAELTAIAAGMEPDPAAARMLLSALADHDVTPTVHRGPTAQYAEIPAGDASHGTLVVTNRFLSLDHRTSEHNGWMVYLRRPDGTFQERPLYTAGDGRMVVGCATDSAAVAKFVAEYCAAPGPFERARAVLRATILPRTEARDYTVTVDGKDVDTMPWGQAMACAQKSLRNGVDITPGPAGTFTLSAESGRTVAFRPAART